MRTFLNLKRINKYVNYNRFKIETTLDGPKII